MSLWTLMNKKSISVSGLNGYLWTSIKSLFLIYSGNQNFFVKNKTKKTKGTISSLKPLVVPFFV